jgi:hypothetical protein
MLSGALPPLFFGGTGRILTVELDEDHPSTRSPSCPSDLLSDGQDGDDGDSLEDASLSEDEEGGDPHGVNSTCLPSFTAARRDFNARASHVPDIPAWTLHLSHALKECATGVRPRGRRTPLPL